MVAAGEGLQGEPRYKCASPDFPNGKLFAPDVIFDCSNGTAQRKRGFALADQEFDSLLLFVRKCVHARENTR